MVNSISNSPTNFETTYSIAPTQDSIAAEFGGDAAAELAAMVFLFSRERSKDASENRNALENTVQAHQAAQVRLMHDEADSRFSGAVVQGATQALSGMVSLAAASSGGSDGYLQATGKGIDSLGTLGAGYYSKIADNEKADAQAQSNQAGTGVRALEQVEQEASEARDMRKHTLDFMDSIQETKAEADKALVSLRA
jgi:hypothetical protein